MVLDATADGTAVVHPCGEPVASGTDPDFVFGPGDVEIKQFTIEQAGSTCFLATTPVHVKVTLYGSVIDVPAEYGLQYRALASPVTVLDEVYQFNGIGQLVPLRLPRPDVIPPDAPSIVYRIDVQSSSRTYGILANCNSTTNDDATFSANAGAVSTVAYRGISAGVDNCLYTFGDGVTALQVSVLGWLDWTGPDPSSVPPTLRSHEMLADPPGLSPIPPRRVLDTRTGIGSAKEQLLDDQVLSLDLTPYITDSTTSVVMNVTATQSTLAGYVTVFPCDADIPDASNLNFAAGQDVPNLVSVPVALDGTVCFVTSAATHLIADLAGTFEVGAGALGTAIAPERILDTRTGVGAPKAKVPAHSTVTMQVSGRGGIPISGVSAVTMNVTATGSTQSGYVTVFPCDQPLPNASNLNFVAGTDVPNLVTVKLSPLGTVCLNTTGTTDLLADAAMWFGAGGTDGFFAVTPTRVLDTRQPSPLGNSLSDGVPRKVRAGEQISHDVVPAGGLTGPYDPLTGVHAVTLNVTVTSPDAPGYLTVFPTFTPLPNVSNLNFTANQDIANLVTVKINPSYPNMLGFAPAATTHVLADLAGLFSSTQIRYWEPVLAS